MASALGGGLDSAEAGVAGVMAAMPPQYVEFKEQVRRAQLAGSALEPALCRCCCRGRHVHGCMDVATACRPLTHPIPARSLPAAAAYHYHVTPSAQPCSDP